LKASHSTDRKLVIRPCQSNFLHGDRSFNIKIAINCFPVLATHQDYGNNYGNIPKLEANVGKRTLQPLKYLKYSVKIFFNTSDNFHSLSTGSSSNLLARLPPRLLRYWTPLETVIVPESADDLARDDLSHVHADQAQDEHAVAPEVVLGELSEYAGLPLCRVERAQLFAYVLDVTGPVQWPEEPSEEIDDGHERKEYVPEPDEHEEFLVEEIYRERALDDVVVDTWLMTYWELADRNPREAVWVLPVLNTHTHPHTQEEINLVNKAN